MPVAPTSPPISPVSSHAISGKLRLSQISLGNVLEFMAWVGLILATARSFHWILALIIACGSGTVFLLATAVLGNTRAASRPGPVFHRSLVAAAVVALWIHHMVDAWIIGLLPMLGALAAIVWLLGFRQYELLAALLALSPLSVGTARAVNDYSRATAKLPAKSRLWGSQDRNIDRVTRLKRETTLGIGFFHLSAGYEMVHDVAYENTLIALTKLWGPMRGTYAGPYPTKAEALGALTGPQAQVIDPIAVASHPTLPNVVKQIIDIIVIRDCTITSVRCAIFESDCWIVQITAMWSGQSELACIVLVSSSGRWFASYDDGLLNAAQLPR